MSGQSETQKLKELNNLNLSHDDDYFPPSNIAAPPFQVPSDDVMEKTILLPGEKIPGQWIKPDESMACLDVFVSEVIDPSRLWVQLIEKKHLLDKLMLQLRSFYEPYGFMYTAAHYNLCPGLFVLISRNNWFLRAQVLEVHASTVRVQLIDYGKITYAYFENVLYLHKDFTVLPGQAIRCTLFKLQPPETHIMYAPDTRKTTRNLLINKKLRAFIFLAKKETKTLEVEIVDDTNPTYTININEVLVQLGHARLINPSN